LEARFFRPSSALRVSGNLDIGSIIAQIASGGVGGGVLMVIVGITQEDVCEVAS